MGAGSPWLAVKALSARFTMTDDQGTVCKVCQGRRSMLSCSTVKATSATTIFAAVRASSAIAIHAAVKASSAASHAAVKASSAAASHASVKASSAAPSLACVDASCFCSHEKEATAPVLKATLCLIQSKFIYSCFSSLAAVTFPCRNVLRNYII